MKEIALEKGKSLGELSKILNRHAVSFFEITFNQVNQTNDIKMLANLKKYEGECNIESN